MDSIFSITVPGFVFFLLVVCVGYLTIGDLSIKTKKGGLERLINYIGRWIFMNILFLLLCHFIPSIWSSLVDLFNNAWDTARSLWMWNIFEIQLFLFSIWYFMIFFVLKLCIKWINKLTKFFR